MIRVGLTGSIGSGKSFVASILERLNVPVYHADLEARKFLDDEVVIAQLSTAFGDSILDTRGEIDRKALAVIVFSDAAKLEQLNRVIHPLVKADFDNWLAKQKKCSYLVQEAAILFESGFDKFFDKVVVVTAPEQICIQRVQQRDHVTASLVLERMKNQWDPALKAARADYILVNDGSSLVLPQVIQLHMTLTELGESYRGSAILKS